MAADDPDWVREFRRLLNAELPEYVKDLAQAVPTSVVKDIVSDFRSYNPHPAQDPSAKVVPQGAGRVIDGNDAPVASTGTGGWVDAPKVDNWKPPGLREMDAMMDAADLQDRLERVRQLGEAKAFAEAEAEIKQQEETSKKGKKP